MDISIIIVSWQVKDLLKKCLDSVLTSRGVSFEIIVIDNASTDGTPQMLRDYFQLDNVKLIFSDKNLGFAKANNLGLKQAMGDYVLFLNPDTEIKSDTLMLSLDFMKQNPDCGLLGPKMTFADGSFQPSVRRLPTIGVIMALLFKLSKIIPNLKIIEHYLAIDFDYSKLQEAEQIMGAFMLSPRQLILRLNGFDERFFIWFEEVDLCRRVNLAGFKIIYNPQISIIHHGGRSFAQQTLVTNQFRFFQSAFKYFIKNIFRDDR